MARLRCTRSSFLFIWRLRKICSRSLSLTFFRQIYYLVVLLLKTSFSRNFCQKTVRVFRNFHNVEIKKINFTKKICLKASEVEVSTFSTESYLTLQLGSWKNESHNNWQLSYLLMNDLFKTVLLYYIIGLLEPLILVKNFS